MRRLAMTAIALCLPWAASAEEILLRADIAQALVFAEGAEVSRRAMSDIPAGRHLLLIPMRDVGDPTLIEVRGPDGVVVGAPQVVDRIAIPSGSLDTRAEAAARDAVNAARDRLQSAQDMLARRDASIMGLEAQLSYLRALSTGGPDGAPMPADTAQLGTFLGALGTEMARVATDLQAAREARREDEETAEERARELETAERALDRLNAFGTEAPGISVEIAVPESMDAEFVVSYLTDKAGWAPSYDMRLDTGAGRLSVERSINFAYSGSATWREVATRFSSALPNRRRVPSDLSPDPARIMPPPPEPEPAVRSGLAGVMDLDAGMEPVMLAEAARLVVDGLSVVYDYRAPVTVGPSGEVTLPMGDLAIDVALQNRAVPRRDATAFLVSMGENGTGDAILPGPARFFRDGDLVGSGRIPMIPAGAEFEMAFGALDHLRLIWQDLSLDEGDRGVFVSENEMLRRIAFGVENTSAEAKAVRLLYASPFAEQEDLQVSVDFSRAPDERDVEDLRGVHAWELEIAPGVEERIEMVVELRWPEDVNLNWQP